MHSVVLAWMSLRMLYEEPRLREVLQRRTVAARRDSKRKNVCRPLRSRSGAILQLRVAPSGAPLASTHSLMDPISRRQARHRKHKAFLVLPARPKVYQVLTQSLISCMNALAPTRMPLGPWAGNVSHIRGLMLACRFCYRTCRDLSGNPLLKKVWKYSRLFRSSLLSARGETPIRCMQR
jgi:hypothetical protein